MANKYDDSNCDFWENSDVYGKIKCPLRYPLVETSTTEQNQQVVIGLSSLEIAAIIVLFLLVFFVLIVVSGFTFKCFYQRRRITTSITMEADQTIPV